MLSDLDLANILAAQYDGTFLFDFSNRIGVVSVGVKKYLDCTVVAFEGSFNIPDWTSNFQAIPIYLNGIGLVEKGFYDDMPETVTAVMPFIQPDLPILACGHSRGAAHANMFARLLIANGIEPARIRRVKFGEPKNGDKEYAAGFKDSPAVSYRNYRNALEQDFVCTVPLFPYVPSENPTLIDEPAAPDDPWLILARHHLSLYQKGITP